METIVAETPAEPAPPRRTYATETLAKLTAVLSAIGLAIACVATIISVVGHQPLLPCALVAAWMAGGIFIGMAVLAGESWAPWTLLLSLMTAIVGQSLLHRPASSVIDAVFLVILIGDRRHWAEIASHPAHRWRWFPLSLESKVVGVLLTGTVIGLVASHVASQAAR